MNIFDLDIIQPCYNPPDEWEKHTVLYYREICKLLPDFSIRLSIVNDGSSRPISSEKVEYIRTHIPYFTFISYDLNQGKGYALRKGVEQSSATYQIYSDIDFPYQIANLVSMAQALRAGADIVIGVREKDYYDHLSYKRKITSKWAQLLNKLFLRLPINETQSGLKGFNHKGRSIFLKTIVKRFLFDTEFVAMASRDKSILFKIVPLHLRDEVRFSRMSLKTIFKELSNFFGIVYRHYTTKS